MKLRSFFKESSKPTAKRQPVEQGKVFVKYATDRG